MKKTKRLGILTIVAGAFSLISMATNWLPTLMLYLSGSNTASSIGIIGSADGPTAIYVASSNPILFWIRMLIPAAFLVLTVILGVSWRKFKKSGE